MRLLLTITLLPLLALAQDEIPYTPEVDARTNYTAALQTAKTEKKHLYIQIGEPGCPACKRLYFFMAAHPAISDPMAQHFNLETGMERDEDGVVLGSTWLPGSQRLHR